MNRNIEFKTLLGKTLTSVEGAIGDEEIVFTCSTGERFKLFHDQDCCESVRVQDVCGEWADLLHSPVLQAEESTSDTNPEGVVKEYQDSFLWTFYRLATIKGSVVIRWYGESNGYYSESVSFVKL